MESVPEYGDLELGLVLRLVEAREGRPGVGRLEVSRRQVPVTVEEAFTHIRRLISMSHEMIVNYIQTTNIAKRKRC